jgi:hypothetical protein
MNRIKNRLAIAKMDRLLLEAICGPALKLTRWQKLRIWAETVFGWRKKSIIMARGASKPGLAYSTFMYELTGEWLPPPWIITDDETEGEDSE